jgi:hypothetical protein
VSVAEVGEVVEAAVLEVGMVRCVHWGVHVLEPAGSESRGHVGGAGPASDLLQGHRRVLRVANKEAHLLLRVTDAGLDHHQLAADLRRPAKEPERLGEVVDQSVTEEHVELAVSSQVVSLDVDDRGPPIRIRAPQQLDVLRAAVHAHHVASPLGEELRQAAYSAADVDHRTALDRELQRREVAQPCLGDRLVERLVEQRKRGVRSRR